MDGELPLPELSPAPLTPGTLYLVATPIGNMEDITMRAIRTLRDCDLVAAEDTRHTGMLLKRLRLAKRQVSTHKFNEAKRAGEIISLLEQGGTVALVSDAGSPGISDPGQRVVEAVMAAGLRVEPVPGACALIAGLTASGLPTMSFIFRLSTGQKRPAGQALGQATGVVRYIGIVRITLPHHQAARRTG